GQNVGIGASGGVNLVKRDTEAFVGDLSTTTDVADKPTGSAQTLSSTLPVLITAHNQGFVSDLALAGSKQSSADDKSEKQSASNQQGQNAGDYGLGISGDVSFNKLNDITLAYVHDAVVGGTDANITAINNTIIAAISGAGVFTKPDKLSAGIAGSYTQ